MGRTFELDNRGLEPPGPMNRILDKLGEMEPGDVLVARNDRRPLFLYPELEELGYRHTTEPLDDGSFRITIWKGDGREGDGGDGR